MEFYGILHSGGFDVIIGNPPYVNLRKSLAAGRLLILSCFKPTDRRVTEELATRRNELVAALAEEVWFAHITPGGQMEQLAKRFSI